MKNFPDHWGEGDKAVGSFQERVRKWAEACFGESVADDKLERADRLVEEVYELLQWAGYPRERLAALEQYTWDRPVGEGAQEAGGVMTTFAAFCEAHQLDMHKCGENELGRVWGKIEVIRAKQAAKPKGSALPVRSASADDAKDSGRA